MPPIDLPTTSPTLLRLLALPDCQEAWEVFIERYGPLIDDCCRRAGLQKADADDIRSSVLAALLESMRGFRYDPARRFRGYMQRVVDNAIRTHWRTLSRRPGWVGRGGEPEEAIPESLVSLGGELDSQIGSRFDEVFRVVDRVRFEVGPDAWAAFSLTALEGLSGTEAAARLRKSPTSIFVAKSRVLARLREVARPTSVASSDPFKPKP